jgi:hypothetical protein
VGRCTSSRPALGLTQSAIQRVLGASSPGVKRPGRKADHSLPFSAEDKNSRSYTSNLSIRLHGVSLNYAIETSSWRGAQLSTGSLPFTYYRISKDVLSSLDGDVKT